MRKDDLDGMEFVSTHAEGIILYEECNKPTCKFCLFVEHPEGWLYYQGRRFMFERSAETADKL